MKINSKDVGAELGGSTRVPELKEAPPMLRLTL